MIYYNCLAMIQLFLIAISCNFSLCNQLYIPDQNRNLFNLVIALEQILLGISLNHWAHILGISLNPWNVWGFHEITGAFGGFMIF